MHYFIIAGEASGDLHASRLMSALKAGDDGARFTYIGGDRMAAVAGNSPLIHYSRTAFMGFSEVMRHLGDIMKIMKQTVGAICDVAPDCLILVDYPGFNLKIAKKVKKLSRKQGREVPVFYYISPKIWAWKQWRVKTIKKYVDRMFSILPFEEEFYGRHAYEIDYVGNPSVEEVDSYLASKRPSREEFLASHRLRDKGLIALLPGSRLGEIKNNLPVMLKAAERFPQFIPVVAAAPGVAPEFYASFGDSLTIMPDTYALLSHARAAMVTSGTATLEAALFGVPQVVCYRANGSKLSYNLMKAILNVSHVSLPNLIVGETVIPEMLLHYCTPDGVGERMAEIIGEGAGRRAQLEGYAKMRRRLQASVPGTAPQVAASLIIDSLKMTKTVC